MTKDEIDEIRKLILNDIKDLIEDQETITNFYGEDLQTFRKRILKRIENKIQKISS